MHCAIDATLAYGCGEYAGSEVWWASLGGKVGVIRQWHAQISIVPYIVQALLLGIIMTHLGIK